MSANKKKPTCAKGYNCGKGCVSRNKNCAVALEGEAKTYAEWLEKRDAKPSQPAGSRLPDGVQENHTGSIRSQYSFKVGEQQVQVEFIEENGKRLVSFDVGGTYDNNQSLSPDDRALAARRISQVFDYDVSRAPDGTKYSCGAHTDDGQGYKRALAYTRMGFSFPESAIVGRNQFAVVNGGKVDKAATEALLRSRFRNDDALYGKALDRWNSIGVEERAKRARERDTRRVRAAARRITAQ